MVTFALLVKQNTSIRSLLANLLSCTVADIIRELP